MPSRRRRHMIRTFGSWMGLDRAGVGYALTLFIAATAAFTVASVLQIPNAYWAAMPIWVVAQPQRGVLLERALFRVLGTLLGAGVGFCILQVGERPFLVLAALSLWIALSSGLTHLMRKVHAYLALMAGITAAVVVLPSLLSPDRSFEIALARVECTLIGVVMVTFCTGLITPKVLRAKFYERVRALAGDAVAYVADLQRRGAQQAPERRILAEISEVEAAAGLVAAGSIDGYRRSRHVNAFVAASLALMAEGNMLQRRRARADCQADQLPELLSDFANGLRTNQQPKIDADLQQLVTHALLADTRLAFMLEQLIGAEAALFFDGAGTTAPSAREVIGLAPYYEWILARRTGLVSAGVTFAAAAIGLLSGWADGELMALGVCIFSMILGSMPKPQVAAPDMMKGVSGGVLLAIFYRFAIQPHVATVPELIASIAPFILIGAFVRAGRRTGLAGIDANMCFMLASQAVLPAELGSPVRIISGAAALMLAALMVTSGFFFLPRDPVPLAADAARQIVSDLRRLALRASTLDGDGWRPRALRQMLRLMLHLGRDGNLRRTTPQGVLAVFSLGNAIIDIQCLSGRAGTPAGAARDAALGLLADFALEPDSMASELIILANGLDDAAAASALQDAAHALQLGAPLIQWGRTGKMPGPAGEGAGNNRKR